MLTQFLHAAHIPIKELIHKSTLKKIEDNMSTNIMSNTVFKIVTKTQ